MNKFTKSDEGKAAIYTATNGDTFSVIIIAVYDTSVAVCWKTGPNSSTSANLIESNWDRLALFPAGAMFATV